MSDKIKELKEQAMEWVPNRIDPDTKIRLLNAEKFAELIVRQCIDICNQHPSKIFKKEWDADVVAWDITQKIKGRFGVEE